MATSGKAPPSNTIPKKPTPAMENWNPPPKSQKPPNIKIPPPPKSKGGKP